MAEAAPAQEAGVWTPGHRLLTVGLILLVTLVASEALAVATVMPQVEQDLGDLWLYGWVFSGFFLGSLLGIVVAGQACDRMRPVIPFAVGLALFTIGLIIGGLAQSMAVLVGARVLQGVGAGALPAVAYVAIGRQYAPDARPRMFALLSTAWVVPSVIGPGLAAVVGQHFGWRWVFLGLVPLVTVCGLAVIGSVGRIRAPEDPHEAASNLRDAVLIAIGAGLALTGLADERWFVAVPVTVVGLAVLIPAFRRLTPPGTLTIRRGLASAVAIRGLLTFSFFQADAYVPLSLTSVKGVSTTFAGIALTAGSITWTAGSWVQARQVSRTGPRPLVRGGFVFVGAGIALMMITLAPGVPAVLGLVAWGVAGFGIGTAYAPLSLTALALAEPGREGSATAALQLSDVLGTALGTGLGGVIIATGDRQAWNLRPSLLAVYALALTVSVVGSLVASRLPRHLDVAVDVEPEPGVVASEMAPDIL